MLKKIFIAFLVFFALFGTAIFYLSQNLDPVLKLAIEELGSVATQAPVKIENLHFAFTEGKGEINGLTIGNPKGFSEGKALSFGTISIRVDINSLSGDGAILIKNLRIEKPEVAYEAQTNSSSNLGVLSANAKAYGEKFAANEKMMGPAPANAEKSEKSKRKLIIENLDIDGGQIAVSHELLKGKKLAVALPTLHLSNLGKENGGVTGTQLFTTILNLLNGAAIQTAGQAVVQELKGNLEEKMKGLQGKIGGLKGLLGK